jgi:hypothetical protein
MTSSCLISRIPDERRNSEMTDSSRRQLGVGGLMFVAALVPVVATAQSMVHPVEVYGTLGLGQVYLDTSLPDHSASGGGARLFLTRRFAVQGDLVMLRWNDSDRRFEQQVGHESDRTGYMSLVGTLGPLAGTVRPYWLAGVSIPFGGLINLPVGPNVGLGARIFVRDRYFLAPEVRGGYGLLFRASINGGVALGGG